MPHEERYAHTGLEMARTGRAALVLAFALWLLLYPLDTKLRCLLLSLVYSFTEYSFTYFERGKAYTSLAQFLGNVLYMPVLVDVYGDFFQSSPTLYVLLFPVNIWLLEIIQGIAIRWIWGRNVAWCYADYADELLGGLIRIGHALWWWGLGLLLWFFYPGYERRVFVVRCWKVILVERLFLA